MKAAVSKSIAFATLALVAGLGSHTASADSYFDDYGNILWSKEKLHLDNFGIHLQRNPDQTGYIGYNVRHNDRPAQVEGRARRARNYLIRVLKIPAGRLVVVNAGKRNKMRFILQPVNSNLPPPFDL